MYSNVDGKKEEAERKRKVRMGGLCGE